MAERKPYVGETVHYVSYGTPGGEYGKECRAAIVTAVPEMLSEGPNTGPDGYVPAVSLCVLNPTGLFFPTECSYDDGGETPGSEDCLNPEQHGASFRYYACGWGEAAFKGGTWHWPERV